MDDIILRIAKRIQWVEHGGRHTWESCMQSARDRAILQAKATMDEIRRSSQVADYGAEHVSILAPRTWFEST